MIPVLTRSRAARAAVVVAAGIIASTPSFATERPKGSVKSAPRPFLEAAPLLDGELRKGEAPRQFSFTLFGDTYLCERSYRDASVGPVGSPTAAPEPDIDLGKVVLLCDGQNKLVVRHGSGNLESEAYSFASECRQASKEFRENAGCFCAPGHGIMCVERGFVLSRVGAPFSFSSECRSALKGMEREVEIRFKAPAR